MAAALNLVVHVGRLTGGRRKVMSIMELTGMEGETICLQDIFKFRQTGVGADGLPLSVQLVVTLGALLADVPHTRAAPVTASASDSSLMEELGVQPSRYEGPTGIVGVLHDACRVAGIPSVSLWAAVPHYVSLTPSPRAAKALCDRLGTLLDIPLDTTELEEASETYMQQVSEAVAADDETAAYVEELEGRIDDLVEESDLPSGDSLAAELTRFLREREEDDDGDPPVARDNQ